jgi:hypothetical protein
VIVAPRSDMATQYDRARPVLDGLRFSKDADWTSEHDSGAMARYRFGDAILQVSANDKKLLDPLDECYGECAVPDSDCSRAALRCSLRSARNGGASSLFFADGAPSHLETCALGLLHPPRGDPPYLLWQTDYPGWLYIGTPPAPVAAVGERELLFDMERVPYDFLPELLVACTLAAQPGLMAIHAAALKIRERGVLLAGPSHAGKTTLSLHLASKGHTLLGDEVAALRLGTGEVLALRRSIRLRPGPRGGRLLGALALAGVQDCVDRATAPMRVGNLFPGTGVESGLLAGVFFLEDFAGRASVEPFRLSLDDRRVFDFLAANAVAFVSWGLSKETRALRLLALHRLLSRVPCFRLVVGDPDGTCDLIERALEDIC